MKILLDTHALVWWWTDDRRLPAPARAVIEEPGATVLVSAASVWEIATKYRLGKWEGVGALLDGFDTYLRRSRFIALAVTAEHARLAGGLAHPHRDPFDRMLAAQSLHEDAPLVSGDAVFTELGVTTFWTRQAGIGARA